jgi:hypothetical protein
MLAREDYIDTYMLTFDQDIDIDENKIRVNLAMSNLYAWHTINKQDFQ